MSHLLTRIARATGVLIAATTLCSTATTVGPLAQPAAASTTVTLNRFDRHLLAYVNRARAAHGIRRLIVVAGPTDVAHGWSCHMAGIHDLLHNPNLQSALESHGSANWTAYGENIGVLPRAGTARQLFRAYMHSPPHRANILDPAYKYIGLWTRSGHVSRWNTLDFVGRTSSSYNYGYGPTRRRTC
ncbi:MAG TPA: CAP domain-containing protein [Mycobacteriales bacterium]|nr:CAP domain-containing protein [Mycobacteriales bacterium]